MTAVAEWRNAVWGGRATRVLVWLGLACLAGAGLWTLAGAWQEGLSGGRDFVQDYAAVVKIGQGRNPYEPYNDVTQALFGGPPHRGPLYSFHAPSSLPLVVWLLPFALLWGYAGAFLAWGIVSLLALWSICWLTPRALGVPRPALVGLLAALALIALPAIRESFEEGQLNVVVAAGMVGCWAARRAGRSGLAGVLLGVGFALKPIPGLFFFYYAWRCDWRLLVAAGATVALLSAVGVALAGVEGAWLWATVNYPSHAGVWPGYPDNASVRGFFTRIFGPSEWRPRPRYPLPYASLLLWAASGALLTVAALVVARGGGEGSARRGSAPAGGTVARRPIGWLLALARPAPIAHDDPRGDLEIATLTVLTLLVTPIVWPHYYVVLVMPIAVVAWRLWQLALGHAATRTSRQPEAGDALARQAAPPAMADLAARRRIVAASALLLLAGATAVLAPAEYVEPFRGAGGQQLTALLALYAASLVALGLVGRGPGWGAGPAQGPGASPARSR